MISMIWLLCLVLVALWVGGFGLIVWFRVFGFAVSGVFLGFDLGG